MKKIALTISFSIASLFCLTSAPAAGAGFVGAEGCKCHRAEIADWEVSSHAGAFDLLKAGKKKSKKRKAGLDPEKDYTGDEKCLPCHVTGYLEDGGFAGMASTPAMAGVGCEACHGAGEAYRDLHKDKGLTFSRAEAVAEGQLYGSLDIKVCTRCHNDKESPFKSTVDDSYSFNLKKALKKTGSFHDYYENEGVH